MEGGCLGPRRGCVPRHASWGRSASRERLEPVAPEPANEKSDWAFADGLGLSAPVGDGGGRGVAPFRATGNFAVVRHFGEADRMAGLFVGEAGGVSGWGGARTPCGDSELTAGEKIDPMVRQCGVRLMVRFPFSSASEESKS